MPGAPRSSDFTNEAKFGVDWLLKMWDDKTQTLYYQVDNTQDWNYYGEGDPSSSNPNCGGTFSSPYCLITEYDIWTLPQAADNFLQPGDPQACDPLTTFYICNRPVYVAGPAGSKISPNLAGRLTADFALCYQLNRTTNATLANKCLKNAEDIFALADTSFPDPAPTVDSGSCTNCLLTIAPFDGYPENVWEDDMELGATELYFALQSAGGAKNLPAGLPHTNPMDYLKQAAQFAQNYVTNIYDPGFTDTLNLYDVSGLAHFELYRALEMADNPSGLAVSQSGIRKQFLQQVSDAISQAGTDPWGFGYEWSSGDTTSHGAGLSVMASEAYYLTQSKSYDTYSQTMAREYSGHELLGVVLHRWRRHHLPELHPTSGRQSCGRARRNFRWYSSTLGRSNRGSIRFRHFRRGRRHDPLSGKRRRYLQEIQRQRWAIRQVAKSRVPGQYAVLYHDRAGHRPNINIVSDVVLALGQTPQLLTQHKRSWSRLLVTPQPRVT